MNLATIKRILTSRMSPKAERAKFFMFVPAMLSAFGLLVTGNAAIGFAFMIGIVYGLAMLGVITYFDES